MKLKLHRLLEALTVCPTPVTIALSVMIGPSALAASGTWTGTADDNLYNTAGNWTGAAAPTVNNDIATWNGTHPEELSILWNAQVGGFFGNGVSLVLTESQTSAVMLNNTANTSSFGLNGISIASGAGTFTLGGATGNPTVTFRTGGTGGSRDPVLLNDSTANTATIKANVFLQSGGAADRALTFGGAGNWVVDTRLNTNGGGALTMVKNGAGTLTITNANLNLNNGYTVNAGTLVVGGAGLLGGNGTSGVFGGTVAVAGTLSYQSSASQTISSGITGTGALAQTAGTLTLTGSNTLSGTTTVTGGTMVLSGSGQMSSSVLTINGASARFVQTSSVASTVPITLTQGILDGTTTVGAVTINGSGGIVRNGDGGAGALTIGSLSFSSAGSISFSEDGVAATPGVIVTGALGAGGGVTVNASQTTWASGTTFDLLTFGSFAGTLSDFTKGTISGLSVRQDAALVLGGTSLSLQITVDSPTWTGLDSGNWVTGSTGANGNWKLITSGTQTNYIAGDNVLFDDTVTAGTTAVNIPANVSPALVTFNNSTKDYTVSGGFGLTAGSVIKTGSGKLTISTANTYHGGTTVSAGTVALSGAGTLGATTGALTVNGSGIVDLGTTSRTVGAVSLSGMGAITNGTITPTSVSAISVSAALISATIAGGGSVVQSGSGLLTLSGVNSYTGGTTINDGTLRIQGSNATAGTTTINGAGAVLAGTGNITGDVAIMSGAIAPGDGVTAIGTLTLGNDLHLSPTASNFNMDLSSVDNTSDSVNIGNKLFNGGGTVTFNFSGGKVGETYTLLQFATTDIADTSAFVAIGGTGTFNRTGTALTYTVQTVVAGYITWSNTNAEGGAANLDCDEDGIPNGVEYFMGQTGSTFTANPGLVSGTVTWQKDPAYLGTSAVQTSFDLVDWVPASPAPAVVGNTLQYTPGTGLGKVFIRLVVKPN